MCCCSALICSYMLYANRGCHHSVLPGSVSRVGLMVRCFKNSLSVRTENKWNARLHNLLTILWASRKLPAVFYELTIERMFLWEPAEPSLYISLFIFNSSYMYNTCSTIVCPSFHVTNPLLSLCLSSSDGQQRSGRREAEEPLRVSQ